MQIIHVIYYKNSGLIPVIFIQKLKNTNSDVRFQERSIPVKCKVDSLNYLSLFFFRVYTFNRFIGGTWNLQVRNSNKPDLRMFDRYAWI